MARRRSQDRRARRNLAPAIAIMCALASMTPPAADASEARERAGLEKIALSALDGWERDNQAEALAVFARSCDAALKTLDEGAARQGWERACGAAVRGQVDEAAARAVLEAHFDAWRIRPGGQETGFLTGYFEPEVDGALERSAAFPVPLYRQPDDLIVLADGDPRAKDLGVTGARLADGRLATYPTRQEIDQGALAGRGLELAYVRDRITAFFIHVQGSARIRLPDGRILRFGFAAKNGHPYSSIGRHVSESYGIAPQDMTADRLRAWLEAHPDKADEVMWHNRSYIFFRPVDVADSALGPEGVLGVPLTPLRSLAVDRTLNIFGAPIWIDAMLPDGKGGIAPFRRLMVAQDTGSAITGPARGDIFVGTGEKAGHRAGLVRHQGDFILLWPKGAPLPGWAKDGPA